MVGLFVYWYQIYYKNGITQQIMNNKTYCASCSKKIKHKKKIKSEKRNSGGKSTSKKTKKEEPKQNEKKIETNKGDDVSEISLESLDSSDKAILSNHATDDKDKIEDSESSIDTLDI